MKRTWRRRTMTAGAAGITVAILLTGGCAAKSTPAASTSPSPGRPGPAHQTPNDCSAFIATVQAGYPQGRPSGAGRLPADVHPVSLLECATDTQDVSGDGQWAVVNTIRSTGPIDAYVDALRAAYVRPPQPTPSQPYACPAIGYVERWTALVDAQGRAYLIATPMWGVCQAPDTDVVKALDAVPTRIAATDKIRRTLSSGAQSSGCEQQFAEMAFVTAQLPAGQATAPFFPSPDPDKSFRVCYYRLGPTADRTKPAGDFETSATLGGSQGAAVYDGLSAAPVATIGPACAEPATEYAVLHSGSGNDWSVVELDGCDLSAPSAGPDRQTPEPVLAALLAAKKQR